ncbi:hypothetical protein MHYP_G00130760 [Metynnis hypsauchen]
MAESGSQRRYHFIIFGASGFTGRFVLEEAARCAGEAREELRWAAAGRSRARLETALCQAAEALGKPELKAEVDIIVADVDDPESLAAMCKQAVIVLNCVGPVLWRAGGESVCGERSALCRYQRRTSEAGYVATPIAMVQAAITILNEPDSLPEKGGVYTPGAAFAKTTLIDRLNKHGIQFSVL